MANYCIFTGNLTNDPELTQTANGKDVLNFNIAVNSGWGDNKRTDFVWCKMWDKMAVGLAQYLHKGKKVMVTGRLNTYTKEQEDGRKITYTTLNVGALEFMDARRKDKQGAQPQQQAVQQEPQVTKRAVESNAYNQEEIPF